MSRTAVEPRPSAAGGTSERLDGPTPGGGAYSVAHFLDADRTPVTKDRAVFVEIHEYDEQGRSIRRTYLEKR